MKQTTPQLPEDTERLRAIWTDMVAAMKVVVQKHRITEDELHMAGNFMDRLGQSGMSKSLVDVALAMTSIGVIEADRAGTRSNLTGPYHAPHPVKAGGNLIEKEVAADTPRLQLAGTVRDASSGLPIAGAELDLWSADDSGIYDRKGTHLRGIVVTDDAGNYAVTTVLPNDYSEHDHDPIGELFRAMGQTNTRAAHLHVRISVGGRLCLTTQVFMSTSGKLDEDYVDGAVSQDLIANLARVPDAPVPTYAARFDFAVSASARP